MADWIGPAVTAALISSVIAVVGWLVSGRSALNAENRRRKEAVADVQSALLAEIRSIIHNRDEHDSARIMRDIEAKFAAKADYRPFVPREPPSSLFAAVSKEISLLPNVVIDQVVLFYRQQHVVSLFADDIRARLPEEKDPDQRMQLIADYLALRDYGAALGVDAANALQQSLRGGFNKRDGDPSDR